ncbi:hypothetical protein AtEden1_Chr3g0156241 [Arabidopsis thaliana]
MVLVEATFFCGIWFLQNILFRMSNIYGAALSRFFIILGLEIGDFLEGLASGKISSSADFDSGDFLVVRRL